MGASAVKPKTAAGTGSEGNERARELATRNPRRIPTHDAAEVGSAGGAIRRWTLGGAVASGQACPQVARPELVEGQFPLSRFIPG